MRHLAAISLLALLGLASSGCRGAGARILSVDVSHPEVAEVVVRTRVTRLWNRQQECRVVAEYAGWRGESGVPMTEGMAVEEVATPIGQWSLAPEAPFDHVRITFFLRDRKLHTAQFPPPFDPRAFSMDPQPAQQPDHQGGYEQRHDDPMQQPPAAQPNPLGRGGEETRRTDQRRGQPPAQPATGGQTQQTDLLRQGAADHTPCPVCEEPRGNRTPCPHCGIE